MSVNPRNPLYIVSKGRWESRLTSKALTEMMVPHHIIVEEQEYLSYKAVISKYATLLVLDKKYQEAYDTCDDLGDTKSKGPGAARNFAWDHSISTGAENHWVMDDNIRRFFRFQDNRQIPVGDGTIFCCMEDFCNRYKNIGMAGPNYTMFLLRKRGNKYPPFVLSTRIYSCNFIRNYIPYRIAFGTEAIGHFLEYEINGQIIKAKEAAKIFNQQMISYNYSKQKTGLWNNRPTYWKKKL